MLWRITWTIGSLVIVETLVLAVALAPVVAGWIWLVSLPLEPAPRAAIFALAIGPSYALFVLILLPASAVATRVAGWRTPANADMRIADYGWPLLKWARYMAALHVVRVLAGQLLHGTPVWTAYLRMCGARVGRRVYINSLSLSDYNLLEFGDDVVIGSDVHISGHTVERGIVKTARVKLGDAVTVGVGSIVDIGVTAGPGCQIGALTLVPKYSELAAGGVYVGIPARRIGGQAAPTSAADLGARSGAS